MGARAASIRGGLSDLITVTDAGAQALGHLGQQFVSSGVTQRVVDDLETVQVDKQQAAQMALAPGMFQGPLGTPQQLPPVRQPGEEIEIRQVADLVLGRAAVGHVLHHAGITAAAIAASARARTVRLGLQVDDTAPPIGQFDGHVCGQHRTVGLQGTQHAQHGVPVDPRHHADQAPQPDGDARVQPDHQAGFWGEIKPALPAFRYRVPVEAAHARQVQCARQAGAAAQQLLPRAGGPQQVPQAPFEQAPLRCLHEKVVGARAVGPVDRLFVVQAGEHQHRYMLQSGQGPQALASLKAVQVRHQGVQHHDIRYRGVQVPQSSTARGKLGDHEAATPQRHGCHHEVHLVIVDEQHRGCSLGERVFRRGGCGFHRKHVMGLRA